MRNTCDGPVALQVNAVKEAQRTDCLREITRGDATLVDQIYLVLTNLFRSEQLRRLAEMPGKVFDAVDVDPDGVSRSVAYPQVVDHALTKSSHGKLLSEAKCSFGDKHYALLKGAFRYVGVENQLRFKKPLACLPRSGFVQSVLSNASPSIPFFSISYLNDRLAYGPHSPAARV